MKIVILGAGEVGYNIASRLAFEKKDVVVIDKDENALKRVSDALDVQVLKGSGSSPKVLEEAGLNDADVFLAVSDSDHVNLVACLFADHISKGTKKLARLRDLDYSDYKKAFKNHSPHINTIINPDIEAVKTIERFINVPAAVDIGEFADGQINLIGIRMEENSFHIGIPLMKLPPMNGNARILIAAIIRNEQLIIPRGDDKLEVGDLVYYVCKEDQLNNALKFFNKDVQVVKRVLIIGGGRVGYRMAKLLEDLPIYTKIIENDPERCNMLAEDLNKAIVLQGDGSDQNLLMEENIQDMDMVMTLTGDEETNILSSLLAKRMGAAKTITRISKFSYLPLVEAIGLEHIVSPRLSAVNTILQHIRGGNILSAISIKGEQAEVLETVAVESSDFVGKPLKNLSFPKGALVVGIKREDTAIIPTGESVIAPMDRVIIFAVREIVPKIEKVLSIKLDLYSNL